MNAAWASGFGLVIGCQRKVEETVAWPSSNSAEIDLVKSTRRPTSSSLLCNGGEGDETVHLLDVFEVFVLEVTVRAGFPSLPSLAPSLASSRAGSLAPSLVGHSCFRQLREVLLQLLTALQPLHLSATEHVPRLVGGQHWWGHTLHLCLLQSLQVSRQWACGCSPVLSPLSQDSPY